jgi:homoserine O-succinyltransferase
MSALRIALLNSMPDQAMQQTEIQFRDLLAGVAPGAEVQFTLFTLPEVARAEAARLRIADRYAPFEALFALDHGGAPCFDGLIVTGMECGAPQLTATGFWHSLTRVVDFAVTHGLPTVWSCLAAHAAVLHLHGIERRRLPAKLSGLYACTPSGAPHCYATDLPAGWETPHSRYNDLPEAALRAHGYRILSRGPQIGVDAFAAAQLPFLFLQGHPEYDSRALLREYARDFGRAVHGARDAFPAVPAGLLDDATAAALADLAARAGRGEPGRTLLAALGTLILGARVRGHHAAGLIGNWAATLGRPAVLPCGGAGCERLAS